MSDLDNLLEKEQIKNYRIGRLLCAIATGTLIATSVTLLVLAIYLSVYITESMPIYNRFFGGLNSTLITNTVSNLDIPLYNRLMRDFDTDLTYVNWSEVGYDIHEIATDIQNISAIGEAVYKSITGQMRRRLV